MEAEIIQQTESPLPLQQNIEPEHTESSVIQNSQDGDGTSDQEQSNEQTTEDVLRRSTRARTKPSRLTYEYVVTDDEDEDVAAMLAETGEPLTVEEALSTQEWKRAMKREYESLIKNKTWVLTDMPPSNNSIGCKWVFKIKNNENIGETKFKARLVAKGFLQQYGIDYKETCAPVVGLHSLRTFLSLAVSNDHQVHQMDAKTALLNGDLDKDLEIYMDQPQGFQDGTKRKCLLKKGLYGLKQSQRQWHKKVDHVLVQSGFKMCHADNAIYIGNSHDSKVRVAVYVDDILISAKDLNSINNVKTVLKSSFEMKDLGLIHSFLGIRIQYFLDQGIMLLDQTKLIQSVLKQYGMEDCKGITTPLNESKSLLQYQEKNDLLRESYPYREVIGSLMFIMLGTRPDIAYAVSFLGRFVKNPSLIHWKAVKRVLRYLQETKSYCLRFTKSKNLQLFAYGDSDWANGSDRKSITGICIFHENNLVYWSSKKQSCVTLSTAEAETVAATDASKDAVWISKLISEMDKEPTSVTLYTDNQPCIQIAKRLGAQSRTKHIDVRHLFIQELVSEKKITISYCPTRYMKADILTKALQKSKHQEIVRELGLIKLPK